MSVFEGCIYVGKKAIACQGCEGKAAVGLSTSETWLLTCQRHTAGVAFSFTTLFLETFMPVLHQNMSL